MQCIPVDFMDGYTPMGERDGEGQSSIFACQLLLRISDPQSNMTELCGTMLQ